MSKSTYHIISINLRKWFPPDDELAAGIARLCILKEDLFCDWKGATEESIDCFDKSVDKYFRKYYFLRNMDSSRNGIFQIGHNPIDTRFKFASEIVTSALFDDVLPDDQEEKAIKYLDPLTAENLLNTRQRRFPEYR